MGRRERINSLNIKSTRIESDLSPRPRPRANLPRPKSLLDVTELPPTIRHDLPLQAPEPARPRRLQEALSLPADSSDIRSPRRPTQSKPGAYVPSWGPKVRHQGSLGVTNRQQLQQSINAVGKSLAPYPDVGLSVGRSSGDAAPAAPRPRISMF